MSREITNTPDEGVGVHRLDDILDVPERESLEAGDLQTQASEIVEQLPEGLVIDETRVCDRLRELVEEYDVPPEEARQSVVNSYLDEADIPRDVLDVPERESLRDRYDRAGTTKLEAHTVCTEHIDEELLHGEWIRLKLVELAGGVPGYVSADGKFMIEQKRLRVYVYDKSSGTVREGVIIQEIPYQSRTDADNNIDLREHYRTTLVISDDGPFDSVMMISDDDEPLSDAEVDAFRPIDDARGGEDE
jgi:hypothetical protein